MKKLLSIFTIVIVFLMVSNANATNIAIIDIEQVVENSVAMKGVHKKLTSKKEKMQKELEKEESALNAKRDDIAGKSSILSKEALNDKMADFQQDVVAFQKKVREREDALQHAYMGAVGEITEEIKTIVKEMKSDEKYNFDVAITSSVAVYSDESLDISAEVLKRLNKKVKSVQLSI